MKNIAIGILSITVVAVVVGLYVKPEKHGKLMVPHGTILTCPTSNEPIAKLKVPAYAGLPLTLDDLEPLKYKLQQGQPISSYCEGQDFITDLDYKTGISVVKADSKFHTAVGWVP